MFLRRSFRFYASASVRNLAGRRLRLESLHDKKRPFVVSIEGNIGSGKSTLMKRMESSENVEAITEPLHHWTNVGGHNALELLYEDSSRWSFLFNTYAQLTRINMHSKETAKPVKILERSIYSTRFCFVESTYRSGIMHPVEYNVLTQWFDWLVQNNDLRLDLIVYLRADPEKCYQRLKTRDRKEEAPVPLDYLRSLHDLHEEWLIEKRQPVHAPVLVLDANSSLSDMDQIYEDNRKEILRGFS